MSVPFIAVSPRHAAKLFFPNLSERLVRRMIRQKIFRPILIGRRTYLLASEIEAALIELGTKQNDGSQNHGQ